MGQISIIVVIMFRACLTVEISCATKKILLVTLLMGQSKGKPLTVELWYNVTCIQCVCRFYQFYDASYQLCFIILTNACNSSSTALLKGLN